MWGIRGRGGRPRVFVRIRILRARVSIGKRLSIFRLAGFPLWGNRKPGETES